MFELAYLHTTDLTPDDRQEIRQLLDSAFADGFSDVDWQHTLGGAHVVARIGGELVGHVSVVGRRLLQGDRAIRTGYVEGLAVRADRRRAGRGSALMSAAERYITAVYELGVLSDGSGVDGFYRGRGWLQWQGPTSVLSPTGLRRTPDDDGGIYVLRTPTSPHLDLAGPLTCVWRPGDVW